MSVTRIGAVGIDCTDLDGMVAFWAAVSGLTPLPQKHPDYVFLVQPDDRQALRLFLQRVPEPVVGKNRLHVDFYVEDVDAAAAGAEAVGARRVERFDDGRDAWVVLADPEGNQFCYVQLRPGGVYP